MTTLITGGAGFIGSHVVDALLGRGKRVICIDNLFPNYDPDTKLRNINHNIKNPNFTFVKEDIKNFEAMEEIFKKFNPKHVIHFAARTGVRPSIENPSAYEKTNIGGTVNMLELSKKYNIEKFIFASSSSVYGNNKKIPFSEDDPVETQISPYAVTKRSCELLCYNYNHLYSLNTVCLRFFTVYGPRGRPDMAPYLFTKLIHEEKPIKMFGDGTTRRDYTYISDIVNGIMSTIEKDFKFEIINLGNSKTIELKYFISLIENLLEKKADIKGFPEQSGDVKRTYADISKAKKMLNYNPKTSIEEGMKLFIKWYKEVYNYA